MRLLASSRLRRSAPAQAGESWRFFANLSVFLAALLRACEAWPSSFFARPWLLVAPALTIRLWARAIAFAIAGGIGWQTAWGVRRQVAAARPVTGWTMQPAV